MASASSSDLGNAHHGLRALDHADDPNGVRAAAALLRWTERVDPGHDPLDVFRVVRLGECDGLDVSCPQLQLVIFVQLPPLWRSEGFGNSQQHLDPRPQSPSRPH